MIQREINETNARYIILSPMALVTLQSASPDSFIRSRGDVNNNILSLVGEINNIEVYLDKLNSEDNCYIIGDEVHQINLKNLSFI